MLTILDEELKHLRVILILSWEVVADRERGGLSTVGLVDDLGIPLPKFLPHPSKSNFCVGRFFVGKGFCFFGGATACCRGGSGTV
jgi:hypothetical protein